METIDFKPTAVVIRRGLEPEKKLQIFSLVPSKNRGVGGYKLQMQHFCVFDDL
jgi:hypothetical protein